MWTTTWASFAADAARMILCPPTRGVNATATFGMPLRGDWRSRHGTCKTNDASRRIATLDNHTYGEHIFPLLQPHRLQHKEPQRNEWITADIEERIWSYIGGIARKHGFTAMQVGGIENHIHALTSSPPSISPSQIAQWVKGGSSRWIHEEFPHLGDFGWQDGFGVFSVCKSHSQKVIEYIKRQREHHDSQTFEEEYVELLRLHEIDYDERYLFG